MTSKANPWADGLSGRVMKRNHDLGGVSHILETAARLGLPPASPSDLPRNEQDESAHLVSRLRSLAAAHDRLLRLRTEADGLEEKAHSSLVTDVDDMERKAAQLTHAEESLRRVINFKDRLIARLQQPFSGAHVAVETAHQASFVELLKHAAADVDDVRQAEEHLQWLRAFDAPSDTWEQKLASVQRALVALTQRYERLEAARVSMASLRALTPCASAV
eukprot:jgi/Mesvir1/26295/Mv12881-RA.1